MLQQAENKSPSYNAVRSAVRNWLLTTPEGKYATGKLKQFQKPSFGHNHLQHVIDEAYWTDHAEIYREYKDALILASNNAERRRQFERGEIKPTPGSRMMKIFSPPLSYTLRRQAEEMDPDYWNDPRNVLREALANPEWTTVPADYLRGQLESLLPKAKKGQLVDATGGLIEATGTEAAPAAKPEAPPVDPNALVLPAPSQAPAGDAVIVTP